MKKSLIGLNAFNSKSKVSNANWENATKEATYIENGDNITLKASFVDSRNRITGNINLDQDTTIELSYMFYYINRGGTPNKSLVNDPNFPNRQQLPLEYFNNGTENENNLNPKTGITPQKPNGTSAIADLPITDPTQKTPENLAPLVESIVHPYSTNAISKWFDGTGVMPSVNFSQMIVGESYQITSLGNISTELWQEAGATSAPFVGQIFKCVASPGSLPQFPIITADLAEVGKTYKIISLGVNNDTNWVSLNPSLTDPSVNDVFDCLTAYPTATDTDPTKMTIGTTYRITNSNGYDFSTFGGPSLPTNNNEAIDLNTESQQGIWYTFTQTTKVFTDGTFPVDYTAYTGTAIADEGDQFVSLVAAQNIQPIAVPTDKNGIYIVNENMTIQVNNQGFINWDLLGYDSNIPTDNDLDIFEVKPNIPYKIVSTGKNFGLNNQFEQTTLGYTNIENNIVSFPEGEWTPRKQEFTSIELNGVIQDEQLIGEYFVVMNNNNLPDSSWEIFFDSIIGSENGNFANGTILQLKQIPNPPQVVPPGSQVMWLVHMGIPVGTKITASGPMPNYDDSIWEQLGFENAIDYTFTTTIQPDIQDFQYADLASAPLSGSFTFDAPRNMMRPYELQVPFTFTTTTTYPSYLTTINVPVDTSYVANVVPTDKVLQIQNYNFPINFTLTSAITTNTLNPTLTYEQIPSGTIQEDYDEADLLLYDLEKINHIRANNPVGFSNTIDVNNPDGLPYLLSYCSPKNVNGTTTFDPEILDPGEIKPFIKKWKMVLKRGSYTADYLAEIITRGMSIQKQKVQTTTSGSSRFLGTPNGSINSQMYKTDDFSYIRNKISIPNQISVPATGEGNLGPININASCPWYGFIPPNCEQGAFPSNNQSASNVDEEGDEKLINPTTQFQPYNIGKSYQPNLMYNPKNKNILPGYDGNETTLPDTLPVNPKYSQLDFNNPDSNIQDDTPFIYRPNAFTMRDSENPSQAKVRLAYNDYNLSNFNGIKPFGDVADQNIKNIEMMYRPLVSDMDSSYFTTIQKENGLPVNKDYSIKPIISVPVAQLPALNVNTLPGINSDLLNQVACYSAPNTITTPVVGAPLMNLTYNQENNGLFEFGYMHTPIYAKLTAESDDVQECVGMYPNNISLVNFPANKAIIKSFAAPEQENNIDVTSDFQNGQIYWAEKKDEITPTSLYGIPIANLGIWFTPFNLIYDETKPNEYVTSNTSFELFFVQTSNEAGPIPDYELRPIGPVAGDHLVIKGSLLNGIDGVNDLTITIVLQYPIDTQNDPNAFGSLVSFGYTFTISGTPTPLFYESITNLNGVVQLAQQSGIILYDMKATKSDGTSTPFWENLGFNPSSMTYKATEPLSYEKFLSLTTKGFLGTSNIFDSETLSSGTTEQSYAAYTDALNMLGWYDESQVGSQHSAINETLAEYYKPIFDAFVQSGIPPQDPLGLNLDMTAGEGYGVFTLQKKILYSLVETTIPLSAKNTFSDNSDAGHYLICIEGYGGSYLLTDNDKLNVKSLVSTYYTGPNAFVSNNLADSALYEHIGSPMKIQNFKVRILNAYTGEEVENLGPNSSIYLEITKNLNKNNISNITSSN